MTDKQNGRLQRGIRVNAVLVTYTALWTANLLITAVKLAIVNSIARIQALAALQSTSISGNTSNKLMNCMLMATTGSIYAAYLLDWAISTNNTVLAAEIAFSYTDLSKGVAENVINHNQLVHDRLGSNMAAMILAGYPVTAPLNLAYQTLITNFATDLPLWKNADANIKTATAALKVELNNLTLTLFDSLKRNLSGYKAGTTATFYGNCVNSMRTVTTGTRKIYLRLKFVDADTLVALTKVNTVLILNAVSTPNLGSKRGYGTFYSLSNGNGRATCTKDEYTPVNLTNIPIRDGVCLKMTIAMKLAPMTLTAKEPKEVKNFKAAAKEVVVEGATITEPSTKKRKKVAKKAVVSPNPSVLKSETVAHKTKTKK